MIGRLRGPILEKVPPTLIIEAGGVGYTVDTPLSTFYHLPEVGEEVSLCIQTVVREDAIQLFGFLTSEEHRLFAALLRVTGIGARLALQVLSGLSARELWRCIQEGDTRTLSRIPGIGKKTAERLILELRDSLDQFPRGVGEGQPPAGGLEGDPQREAVAALQELGYGADEAERAISRIGDKGLPVEELLKRSLRQLAR